MLNMLIRRMINPTLTCIFFSMTMLAMNSRTKALIQKYLFVASRPIGANPQSIVHIVLSLFIGGVSVTPSDKKLLEKALARAGADVYMWGA